MIRNILFFIQLTSFVQAGTYLALDNETVATEKELARDSFLAHRTSHLSCKDSHVTLSYPAFDVTNTEGVFDHTAPFFYLESLTGKPCNQIWWQIAFDKDFRLPVYNAEKVQDFEDVIMIDRLTDTFFNPSQQYFFRVRGKCDDQWSAWSTPFAFSVNKPSPAKNIVCQKCDNRSIKISWDQSQCPETHYLVFASNTLDFTPPIYEYDSHDSILIAEVDSSHVFVDDTFRYYRIVAEAHDQYSVPSPIIPIHSQPQPSHTHSSDWERLSPYFLPDDHPIKEQLDHIFRAHKSALKDKKHLKKAGFRVVSQKEKKRHPAVVSHPKLPGYLIKLYTDKNKKTSDVEQHEKRVLGAIAVQQALDQYGYNHIFKVPKKWIYPVSEDSNYKKKRKNFILVVEDMHILKDEANREKWKSPAMTEEMLEAIYHILEEVGLSDTLFPFNLPFSKDDGKLAFIDTEIHHFWPVDFRYLGRYLSPEMALFWQELIASNAPQRQRAA